VERDPINDYLGLYNKKVLADQLLLRGLSLMGKTFMNVCVVMTVLVAELLSDLRPKQFIG
jgi:hypothetical protein